MRLSAAAEAEGFRLLAQESTVSTNDDCMRAAREGDPGRLWIVAAEQQSGRGRHGRAWSSPPGNLYASLLLSDPCPPHLAPQLGFVAGLALHEAVESATDLSAPRLALKWPNDLLLDGAKVAGLLLEGQTIGGTFALVIGIGVNVTSAPGATPYPATTLGNEIPGLTREALFEALSGAMTRRLQSLQAGSAECFASIRRLWLARAAGIGGEVRLRLPSGERHGIFAGLDANGRLELRTEAGVELIDAADLYFPQLYPKTAEPDFGARSPSP